MIEPGSNMILYKRATMQIDFEPNPDILVVHKYHQFKKREYLSERYQGYYDEEFRNYDNEIEDD